MKAEMKYRAEQSNYELSLSKMAGKNIVDVIGYVSTDFGEDAPVFKTTRVVFEDGQLVRFQGEHDIAYIPANDGADWLSVDFLNSLND